MSNPLAIVAALATSASAAVAATLQSQSAARGREPGHRPTGGLVRFARRQLSGWLWWCALAVQILGFALHALALSAGSLSLVQPLMASAVVLALPLNHWVSRTRISGRELLWAGVLAVGLTGFLLTATPAGVSESAQSALGAWYAGGAGLLLVALCILLASTSPPGRAAALLGAAAASAFVVEAAMLKLVTSGLSRPLALLSQGAVYGLVLAGISGVALTQLAYRAGPISTALPAIVTVNPLLSVVYGVLVQREPFRHSPMAVVLEVLCFALLCSGAVALTRGASPEVQGPA